jgi:rhomboid family GlyGly-CTERM serine protease
MAPDRPVNPIGRWLASAHGDGRGGVLLLALCALLVAISLSGEAGRQALQYDRQGLVAGEYWRLLTAHVVHLGPGHAVLNSLGLALMWVLFVSDYRPLQWLAVVLAAALVIDAGLWFADSTVAWYVGSSGVLHGVLAAGTLAHLRRGEIDGWLLTVFLGGKLAFEQWGGSLPYTAHMPVVVDAHLFGACGGLAIALCMRPQPAARAPL